MKRIDIEDLKGKKFKTVKQNDEMIIFTDDEREYRLEHCQDCCEDVHVSEIIGNLTDLLDSEILMAEVVEEEMDGDGLLIWTFYKFATQKGYVTIIWRGESNGYYGVSVDIFQRKIKKGKNE